MKYITAFNDFKIRPNSPQVSLRDALEVVPLFDECNIPSSNFIEGRYEAKAMLPTLAAQENLARLLRSKLSGEQGNISLGQLIIM